MDYLLFVDEAPLTGPIQGSSGFAEQFAGEGPFDSKVDHCGNWIYRIV